METQESLKIERGRARVSGIRMIQHKTQLSIVSFEDGMCCCCQVTSVVSDSV